MSKINIATYADEHYIQHACVMIASLNEVAATSNHYVVYLFHSRCSDNTLKKVKKTAGIFAKNITVKLIEIKSDYRELLKSKKVGISDAIYDKLLIYNYLPTEIERIFFIDADVVLKRDPGILYKIDLEGKVLAAVKDYYLKFSQEARNAIGLNSPNDYFNSGVMIVNLKVFHKNKIFENSLRFALEKGHLTKLHDQDALNHAVNGNWKPIDCLWNPRPENKVNVNGETISLERDEVYSRNLAYLIHFSGSNKPWKFMSTHPAKAEYWKHLKMTEFRDYTPLDKSLINFLKLKAELLRLNILKIKKRLSN